MKKLDDMTASELEEAYYNAPTMEVEAVFVGELIRRARALELITKPSEADNAE